MMLLIPRYHEGDTGNLAERTWSEIRLIEESMVRA